MKTHRASSFAVVAVILGLAARGAAAARTVPGTPAAAENPYPGYHSALYSDPANWLCRPDKDDVCDHDLDATSVGSNGQTHLERFRMPILPKIDCFYVYPTISTDTTPNSDLIPGDDQELFVVRQQAARLGSVCRVFAPIYRQVTLTALTARLSGQNPPIDPALAYGDVADAWKHYVANDNQGRGVLLIGHSQGAGVLTQLIKNEIDPNPLLRGRLVSAMLLGGNVQVPQGGDVGGDFANIPLCHRDDETGCVIAYSTFRSTAPPPDNSLFGGPRGPGLQTACVNPAAVGGGSGTLHPYFPTDGKSLPILPATNPVWVDPSLGVEITTPFVTLPRFVDAECAEHNGFVYLAVTVHGNPADPRIDDIGGDLTPEWGLHLVDVNLAMGDLVSLAGIEARAYCTSRPCPSPRRPLPLRLN
jgi:DUF3089 family protein